MRRVTLTSKGLLAIGLPILAQAILLSVLFVMMRRTGEKLATARLEKDITISSYRLLALRSEMEHAPDAAQMREFSLELTRLKALAAATPQRADDALIPLFEKPAPSENFRSRVEASLADHERISADQERAVSRARDRMRWAIVGGGILNAGLAALAVVFLTRNITRRVRVVMDNVERFERNETLQPRVEGNDEIAEFDERFHDMATALRLAEENLQRFFHISLDMLCIANFEGFFTLVNPAWQQTLGYSLETLYSRPFIEFVHPDDREATIAEARRLTEGDLSIRFENRYRHANGSYRWLLWNAAADPETRQIFAAASDVTDQREFAVALQDRNTALEAANRELESFSYSVSHDLRSPLRAVDGFARIIEEDYASAMDDEGRRVLGVIRNEARRMGTLIDDLLSFSRLGRQPLNRSEVDLARMAEEIVAAKRQNYPDKEIVFIRGDAPTAQADRSAIRQVMFNLIANAVKYAKPDAPVHIEFGGRGDANDTTYWVRDQGIGFDMRYAEKIFGVFQRLHTNADIEGTGVGLAIVQRIVQRHGGRVWAEGEPEKGSTFYFTLPRFAASENDELEAVNG